MAQKEHQPTPDAFSCWICLDLLNCPVTVPCGHNYCKDCLQSHWDSEEWKKIYSCPQCHTTFTPRPVLLKNDTLAALVEEVNKSRRKVVLDDYFYAGAEDVACDFCTGRKLKAQLSCLQCMASYCPIHIQPHFEVAPLKKHKLVEPSKRLMENICSRHDEVMKLFCRTDQQSICYVCSLDEHKGHFTVSAAAERADGQRKLEVSQQNIQQRIQDRERDVNLLQQEAEAINRSADKAVEDTESSFTELICLMTKCHSEVTHQVQLQQKTKVSQVKEMQEKLKQEIAELKRKDVEIQTLLQTQDNIQFLQAYPSLSALSQPSQSPTINIRPQRYFETVTVVVSAVRDKLQEVLRGDWTNILQPVAEVDVSLPQPEPTTREEFFRYSCDITLDPNTAHDFLLLSDGDKKVTNRMRVESYPDHPDRFTKQCQVLSRESLTGRCYWEVKWDRNVHVAVAFKNISREGSRTESEFGHSNNSCALCLSSYRCYFLCHGVNTPVSDPQSSRIGVYLDHRAGILSFYSISETMTLLHRFQATFDQPLYVGFGLGLGSTAEICKLTKTEVI
ncbi:tripartite motif-containing protein 16-like [Cheilinus undulatus]|uniref:tripartite motif-containing protein 16-like n=1 Tax=Cheilinus undulatus TaxID=241271 RepID=UPI001BD2CB76|nr:tripartite motif-containing protein 16-like [Cheilinus undulatus]